MPWVLCLFFMVYEQSVVYTASYKKMQSIFILDAVIPGGTKAQYLQTCSEPVYFMTSF